jgi:phosphoglycerate dehydrogenase-like enzyme
MKILNRDCVDFLVVDDDPLVTRFLSDYLQERGHTCATLTKSFQTAAWLELHDCEVVVVDLNMPKVDGISLITYIRETQPNLPVIVFTGIGYEEERMHAALRAGANGYVSKHLPMEQARLERGEFNQAGSTRMIAESTCGIFGLGGTGLALARLLRCMGAQVHGINRRGESPDPIDWVGTPDDLDAMLAVSDIFFVTAPLTRQTIGVIGHRELALMKEDAIVVNVARGELFEEAALYHHLRNNRNFFACIDAWWIEPVRHGRFDMNFPFLDLPNVIGSPHNSAAAGNGRINGIRRAAVNCLRALAGDTPLHLIAPEEREWHVGRA